MNCHFSKLLTFSPVSAICVLAQPGYAQGISIDGTWVAGAFVSAGISGEPDRAVIRGLEGRPVRIAGNILFLPDQTSCALSSPHFEIWHNDMATFGSGGGDWSDIGLAPTGPDFAVETWELACTGDLIDPVALVAQANSDVVLLDLRERVYFPLKRLAVSQTP